MPQDGWWNGDGGSGTITINTETLLVTVEHYDNEMTRTARPTIEMEIE
jgi:hypothetical protein